MSNLATIAENEEALVREMLVERLSDRDTHELQLTGLEVLGFLAAQAVLPIVTNLVSSTLYDGFRRIRTRDDARRGREALRDAVPAQRPVTDPAEVRREVVVVLVAEGIPAPLAEDIARHTHERVTAALAGSPKPDDV